MLSGGHVTDPSDMRMKETSRRHRRMAASSERGQGPEGAVAPWMDGWIIVVRVTLVQNLEIRGHFKILRDFTSSIEHIFSLLYLYCARSKVTQFLTPTHAQL